MAFNPRDFAPLPGIANQMPQSGLNDPMALGSTEYAPAGFSSTPYDFSQNVTQNSSNPWSEPWKTLPSYGVNPGTPPTPYQGMQNSPPVNAGAPPAINNTPSLAPQSPPMGATLGTTEYGNPAAPTGGQAQNPLATSSGFQAPSWLPQNSFQTSPGATDLMGTYNGLNPRNFASLDAANALAKQLGGNVIATNYEDAMRNPEYNIDFGRGSALNAGQLAYYYGPNSSFAAISDPVQREAAIRRSIEDELRYNDSPMERQIVEDRSGQVGQLMKDVPGGFQSFQPGGNAGSLSDQSFWDFRGGSMPWQSQRSAPLGAGQQAPQMGPGGQTQFPGQGQGQGQLPQMNPFSMFNMSPNMNSLYFLNQRPNNQLGGFGMLGAGGQFSPFGAGGFGGFGNQMPFTMGGMPGFMGQRGGLNPLTQQGGNGLQGLLQLLSMLGSLR